MNVKLTNEHFNQIKTPAGGFRRRPLEILGVPWPPQRGWKAKLIGTEIDESVWLAAKDAHRQDSA